MTTVVLADDHQIVRQGLSALLEREDDLVVAGEAGTGPETLELVGSCRPDVLVLDLALPGLDGLEVTRRVRQTHPDTHVVILSMHNNGAYVAQAVRHGATGYVLKESSSDELVRAVRAVLGGERFFSQGLEALVADADHGRTAPTDRYEALTSREREVLHLVAEGLTSPEAAERLAISTRTVETHRSNLMAKLGLRTQTDLVHFALQRGLVPLGPREPRESPAAPDE